MSQRFTVTKASEESPIGEGGDSYGAVKNGQIGGELEELLAVDYKAFYYKDLHITNADGAIGCTTCLTSKIMYLIMYRHRIMYPLLNFSQLNLNILTKVRGIYQLVWLV